MLPGVPDQETTVHDLAGRWGLAALWDLVARKPRNLSIWSVPIAAPL